MTNVVLIGGNSGLGLKIYEFLKINNYNTTVLQRSELDISNSVTFSKSIHCILNLNPDIIILNSFDRNNVDSQLNYLKYLWNELRYKIKVKIIVLSSASTWFFNWKDKIKQYADAKRKLSEFIIQNGFIKYSEDIKARLFLIEPATIETYKDLKNISIERDTLILSYEEFFEMFNYCLNSKLKFLRVGGEGNLKV